MALPCWLRSAVRWLPFVSLLWLGACGEEAAPGLVKVVHGPGAGEWVDPLPVDGGPATVWIFVTVDCPIANAYAPEIGAIGARCRELGVEVLASMGLSRDEAAAELTPTRQADLDAGAPRPRDVSLDATRAVAALSVDLPGVAAGLGRVH